MIDPIVDFLNRIKNAQMARKSVVYIPFSKIKHEIALVIEKAGYIGNVEKRERKKKMFIKIYLKYDEKGNPKISDIRRVSKQGKRIYVGHKDASKNKKGFGIAILTTSKGIMTDRQAKKEKVGGELICEVW